MAHVPATRRPRKSHRKSRREQQRELHLLAEEWRYLHPIIGTCLTHFGYIVLSRLRNLGREGEGGGGAGPG